MSSSQLAICTKVSSLSEFDAGSVLQISHLLFLCTVRAASENQAVLGSKGGLVGGCGEGVVNCIAAVLFQGGNIRDKLKGTNGAKFTVFLQIFADFCRFSLFLGITAFRRRRFSQTTADFRRKPQETADFRRNPFVPFSLSLLIPPNFCH